METWASKGATYAFLLSLCLMTTSSCKPNPHQKDVADSDEDIATLAATVAATPISDLNFDDMKVPEGESALLGTIRIKESAEGFATQEFLQALKQEMWRAFQGTSPDIYFLTCEGRSILVATREPEKCSQPLKEENFRFTFSFQAIRKTGKNTFETCSSLLPEGCKIYQTVMVDDPDNGFQRGAIFTLKAPVAPWVYLMTRGLFNPPEKNLGDFMRRWIQSPHVLPLMMPTYDIPEKYGRNLAAMFGDCGKQWMNLLNVARYTKESIWQRHRPVTIVNSLVQGAVGAASVMMSLGVLHKTVRATGMINSFVRSGFIKGHRPLMVLAGRNMISLSNLIATPSFFTNYTQVEEMLKSLPQNHPLRVLLPLTQATTYISTWGGLGMLGLSGIKNFVLMKQSKGLVALADAVRVREHELAKEGKSIVKPVANAVGKAAAQIQEVYKVLAAGDISKTRETLCRIQLEAGTVTSCAGNKPEDLNLCSK